MRAGGGGVAQHTQRVRYQIYRVYRQHAQRVRYDMRYGGAAQHTQRVRLMVACTARPGAAAKTSTSRSRTTLVAVSVLVVVGGEGIVAAEGVGVVAAFDTLTGLNSCAIKMVVSPLTNDMSVKSFFDGFASVDESSTLSANLHCSTL